jgi:FkbM family methyltransferase
MAQLTRRLKTVAKRILPVFAPSRIRACDVRWAYRIILDRNPESRAIVSEKLKGPVRSVPDLRRDLILSDEFAGKNPDLAPFPFGSVVIKELDCGLRLYVDLSDAAIGSPIVRGEYEPELIRLLPALIEPGGTVLDVGANIGYFTMNMAALAGKGGHVVAFEPVRELAELIGRSVAENGLQASVTVENAAVGDAAGQARILYVHQARNQGASHLVAGGASDCATSHEVRQVRMLALDEYAFAGRVGFIKIDVEGAEPLCMKGARRLLRKDRPVILTEVHPGQLRKVSDASPDDYIRQVRELGYRCFLQSNGGFRELAEDERVTEFTSAVFCPSERALPAPLAGAGSPGKRASCAG